jgi:hypothetical protein
MGASSVVFRELPDASSTHVAADMIVDAGGFWQGTYRDFTLWNCEYSDWGSAVMQNQPR